MKQNIVATNNQVINYTLNETIMPYLRKKDNIYDTERVLATFPNVTKTAIKPVMAQRELTKRILSVISALRLNDLTIEEYLSVAGDPLVTNADLMYIPAREISNGNVDAFINSIQDTLDKNSSMEEGDLVEQNQGNEAKPRQ